MRVLPSSGIGFLKALPILSFAFLCHQNAFPIYNELRDASPAKMRTISRTSMAVCACAYMLTGILGYHLFLDETQADLLKNYKVRNTAISPLMDSVRSGFGISFVLSYPVIIFEARSNIDLLLFGQRPYCFWRYFKLNVALVGLTTLVGILAPSIDVVLGLVGSTCSPTMMFVLPALFGLKADDEPWTAPAKRPALALLVFGCTLIPVCTTVWALCDVAHMSFCPG